MQYEKKQYISFFNEHKNEEWFKEKYDPIYLEKKFKEKLEMAQEKVKKFTEELLNGNIDFNLSFHNTNLENLSNEGINNFFLKKNRIFNNLDINKNYNLENNQNITLENNQDINVENNQDINVENNQDINLENNQDINLENINKNINEEKTIELKDEKIENNLEVNKNKLILCFIKTKLILN